MIKITYLGHSAFLIEGEEFSVVTDPFSGIGYEMQRVKADYCISSHAHFDHNYFDGVEANFNLTDSYGPFTAIKTFHDKDAGKKRGVNNVFVFTLDGVKFCHLGDLGEDLSRKTVDKIGQVDVLFIPVGGTYTITTKEAVEYIKELSPAIAVPMHFKTKNSKIDVDGLQSFLSLIQGYSFVGKSFYVDKKPGCGKTEIKVMNID